MMWKYKQLLVSIVFIFVFVLSANAAHAGFLKFDATTFDIGVGDTFDVEVIVDAGSDEINSIDAYINFDENLLTAQTVLPGTFFPSIAQNLTPGEVYIAGYVDDPATSKSGTGTVATITFEALAEGTTTLEFFCDSSVNESSKVIKNDIDATNVIVCGSNGSSTVTIGTGDSTPTPTGTGGIEDADGDGIPDDQETPETLPESGTLENVLMASIPGLLLLAVGILFKFL